MLPPPIPTAAACANVDGEYALVFGSIPAGRETTFGPPVYLRFAFAPALGHDYLIPAQVIEDHGLEISVPEAYDWIEGRGTLFPRADVMGQTPEGQPLERFMKELDLAAPPKAYAARDEAEFPGVPVAVAVASPEAPPVSALLARTVPVLTLGPAEAGQPLAEIVRRWRAG